MPAGARGVAVDPGVEPRAVVGSAVPRLPRCDALDRPVRVPLPLLCAYDAG